MMIMGLIYTSVKFGAAAGLCLALGTAGLNEARTEIVERAREIREEDPNRQEGVNMVPIYTIGGAGFYVFGGMLAMVGVREASREAIIEERKSPTKLTLRR